MAHSADPDLRELWGSEWMGMARRSLYVAGMRESSWGSALVGSLAAMSFACGGATFTSGNDDAGSSGGGSGSSGASSGGGSGSSGGRGGSSSGSGSSSGASSSSGSSSGGTTSSSGSSSGGTTSSSGSSSGGCSGACVDAGPVSPCPTHVPAQTACTSPGLQCEYGGNPVQGCDIVATCSGTWVDQAATDPKCSLTLGQGCPATFDNVAQGSSCSSNGLECNYPKGRCACTVNSGGPIQLIDAATPGHWVCQDPATQGCPLPRAPLGSACSQNGLSCNYGACTVPGGSGEICQNNLWQSDQFACPVFAGAAQ
jgi:hypothetical protein